MAESSGINIVVVTGATGFIGSHIIKLLLEKGYTVRACVRDAKSKKSAFLSQLPGAERLSLYSADLLVDGSFNEAITGAHALIHAAAVVLFTAKDPQKEIVDVTVNGALNVLRSCAKAAKAGTFKRLISTSSIAAIMDVSLPVEHIYTEEDQNASATISSDPYSLSKVLEEQAIDKFISDLPDDSKFSYAYSNPAVVYGPVLADHHAQGSNAVVFELMSGKFPLIPNLGFPAVDVRDVALCHVLLLENPALAGRFVCVASSHWLKELAATGRKAYPQYAWPTRGMPNFLMYLAAIFDSRISFSFLRNSLGFLPQCSHKRLEESTGMKFRSILEESVPEACQSFIDVGLLPKK